MFSCLWNAYESINRNILECKGVLSISRLPINAVLIETYWNVKVLSAGGSGAQTGINRNILECKDFDEKNCVDLSMY